MIRVDFNLGRWPLSWEWLKQTTTYGLINIDRYVGGPILFARAIYVVGYVGGIAIERQTLSENVLRLLYYLDESPFLQLMCTRTYNLFTATSHAIISIWTITVYRQSYVRFINYS